VRGKPCCLVRPRIATRRSPNRHGRRLGASVWRLSQQAPSRCFRPAVVLAVLSVVSCPAAGGLVTARIDAASRSPGKLIITGSGDTQAWSIEVDVSGLPRKAKVYRASLHAARSEPLTGREDWALTNVVIRPWVTVIGDIPGPLPLLAPWYDRFDATDIVRKLVDPPGNCRGFSVDAFPKFDPKSVYLDVEYEGTPAEVPKQPTGLRVVHRAGQTFITWREIDPPVTDDEVTWGALRKALEEVDARGELRYRVYRHTEPITARNVHEAECLARVKPLSCYNVEGRSVERLISMHRRRAVDDIAFARKLARDGYFGRYNIDMPEMDEVIIDRFVIPASRDSDAPLPPGAGLYVHNPPKAGKAYYAVATCLNGVTNTVDFAAGNATAEPVTEDVGVGEPVYQGAGTLKVFYDYPGERRYYVQWTGPPLSNLPNRYYNWSVYLPADPPKPTPVRVFLAQDRFMRPPTRHRTDTILIAGQDGPLWTSWWGYHEALGTLKSFRQGVVRPYTKRRLFAFLDWAVKEFEGDAKRLSLVGGTDALYYGVRHGEKFAYVLTNRPDPDPRLTEPVVRIQNYTFRTPRRRREHIWGKVEWKIPNEAGDPVWEEMDLISYVVADPKRRLAFLSMGPAGLSPPWTSQVRFMKALWRAKQAFTARFYWGGGNYLPIPEGEVGAKDAFDFALDIPMLALGNNSNDRGLTSKHFAEGVPGYWGGGRIADGRRWLADFVDEPERFEITIHGGGRVTYAGGGTSDVTPRRCRKFTPAPGDRFKWENVDLKTGKTLQSGQVVADEHGLVTVPQVQFRGPSRLKIYKAP